jgi:putative hemolysin
VHGLTWSTEATLRLLRLDRSGARAVTEAEISASLEEGLDAGVIEEHEHQMVHNVFRLDDRTLTSLMSPRTEIQWLEATDTAAVCLKKISDSERSTHQPFSHSWYPVCRGSLDDVVGLISVARLLALDAPAQEAIEDHTVPASFLPETLTGMELLEQFRGTAARMVLVVDEYGVVQGLMTPRDLLEAITGELQPEQHTDAWALPLPHGCWELDGLMPIEELKSRLDIDELPEESKGRYNTLAGLLMFESGHLPVVNEKIQCADWCFEVLSLEGRRIDKVLASPSM